MVIGPHPDDRKDPQITPQMKQTKALAKQTGKTANKLFYLPKDRKTPPFLPSLFNVHC